MLALLHRAVHITSGTVVNRVVESAALPPTSSAVPRQFDGGSMCGEVPVIWCSPMRKRLGSNQMLMFCGASLPHASLSDSDNTCEVLRVDYRRMS